MFHTPTEAEKKQKKEDEILNQINEDLDVTLKGQQHLQQKLFETQQKLNIIITASNTQLEEEKKGAQSIKTLERIEDKQSQQLTALLTGFAGCVLAAVYSLCAGYSYPLMLILSLITGSAFYMISSVTATIEDQAEQLAEHFHNPLSWFSLKSAPTPSSSLLPQFTLQSSHNPMPSSTHYPEEAPTIVTKLSKF